MAQGTTTVNFGAFPGTDAVAITVTGITGSPTLGEAWIVPTATADHSADEHLLAAPRVYAAVPSGGSMTITAIAQEGEAGSTAAKASPPRTYGLWTVGWVTAP